jgi:hypothetical protein
MVPAAGLIWAKIVTCGWPAARAKRPVKSSQMAASRDEKVLTGRCLQHGPLADQQGDDCTGPAAKPGVAGAAAGRAGKSLDPSPTGPPPEIHAQPAAAR